MNLLLLFWRWLRSYIRLVAWELEPENYCPHTDDDTLCESCRAWWANS